jgi:hypothetical protein
MSSINIKIFIVFLCFSASGCARSTYKNKLIPGRYLNAQNPYGSYIEVKANDSQYEGEYIAYWNDTLYVMGYNALVKLHKNEVTSFKIILSKNYRKGYLTATGVALIPSLFGVIVHADYRGGFAVMAGVTAFFGWLATLIESLRVPTVISYPKDILAISLSTRYARFPAGLPEGFNVNLLQKPCKYGCSQ